MSEQQRTSLTGTRLVASDIDGTILSYGLTESGRITDRTVEAFARVRDLGLQVVLVTGRPVRWLRPVAEALGGIGPVICSNGAVVYDFEEGRLLHEDPMVTEVLFEAVERIRRLDPQVTFAAETLRRIHADPTFMQGSLFFQEERRRAAGVTEDMLRLGPVEETLDESSDDRVVKLLAKTTSVDPDVFLGQVHDSVGDLLKVTHSAPGVSLLELSARGVDKASALRRFADGRAIGREQVIAFGDMPNDIEMLQWAGRSWAVGSAHPMARSAADHLTRSCEDDGVAAVLEDLLAGGDGVIDV
ncbi:HAD family hydrolase [Nesterenkonia marinintestina]|uniref:HAD family hydrolase n=1 Tax=Nesterenkonia marinintestina TaxID=2979865 RepID=UPI0028FC1967|nr:HAD family hydrolase [Nesterenkonia sp. GX14115]